MVFDRTVSNLFEPASTNESPLDHCNRCVILDSRSTSRGLENPECMTLSRRKSERRLSKFTGLFSMMACQWLTRVKPVNQSSMMATKLSKELFAFHAAKVRLTGEGHAPRSAKREGVLELAYSFLPTTSPAHLVLLPCYRDCRCFLHTFFSSQREPLNRVPEL